MGNPDARVAVVTGGAGGIGLATARRLAGDGATLFIAASAMVLNGAHLGRAASIAARAVVRLGAIVAPQARIPAGAIRAGLAETGWSFLPVIFGVDDAGGRAGQLHAALQRYTAAMARHHRQDQMV